MQIMGFGLGRQIPGARTADGPVRFGSEQAERLLSERVKALPPNEKRVFTIAIKADPRAEQKPSTRRAEVWKQYLDERQAYIDQAAEKVRQWFQEQGRGGDLELTSASWINNSLTVRSTRAALEALAAAPEMRELLVKIDITTPGAFDVTCRGH